MKIKLINDDCLTYIKKLKSNIIDLVVTDPPYVIDTSGGGIYNKRDYQKSLKEIDNGFSEEILDELCRVMKKINIYLFCSQKQILPLLNYFVDKKKCNFNILTWHKTNPVPACGNKYLTDTEFILFFREKGVKIYGEYATKKTYYVTPLNTSDKSLYNHPTPKPVSILSNLIINSSKENDIILDPFMGSGSTGEACKITKRNFLGIEINKDYYKTSKRRLLDSSNEE